MFSGDDSGEVGGEIGGESVGEIGSGKVGSRSLLYEPDGQSTASPCINGMLALA